ncbi:MAG: hypothetical protein JXR83_09595 [Deltaproteobacteria bacterium]|nr:hypothetical protein [Deltaproteobacteria bacterium]
MIVTPHLLALFLSALPCVEVRDSVSCVAQVELMSSLASELPDDPAVNELALKIGVDRDPDRETPGVFLVKLELRNGRGELLLQRVSRVAEEDCQALPGFIASVVSRRLEALPRHVWSDPVETEPFAPRYRLRLLDVQTTPAAPEWRLRVGVAAGAGIGSAIPSLQPHLTAAAWLGVESWPRLVVAVRGAASQNMLGGGIIQMLNGRLGIGVAHDLDLGSLLLVPELTLAAGGHLAQGSEFARNFTSVLPLLALHGGLTLFTRRVIFLTVGFELPLTVVQLAVAEDTGWVVYEEPRFRLHGAVGFAWDLL